MGIASGRVGPASFDPFEAGVGLSRSVWSCCRSRGWGKRRSGGEAPRGRGEGDEVAEAGEHLARARVNAFSSMTTTRFQVSRYNSSERVRKDQGEPRGREGDSSPRESSSPSSRHSSDPLLLSLLHDGPPLDQLHLSFLQQTRERTSSNRLSSFEGDLRDRLELGFMEGGRAGGSAQPRKMPNPALQDQILPTQEPSSHQSHRSPPPTPPPPPRTSPSSPASPPSTAQPTSTLSTPTDTPKKRTPTPSPPSPLLHPATPRPFSPLPSPRHSRTRPSPARALLLRLSASSERRE